MKKRVTIVGTAMLCTLFLGACAGIKENEVENEIKYDYENLNYELVWSDEFDYEGRPDPEKWGYETGYVRNDELQYYTEGDNVKVEDGVMKIELRKEEDGKITSASVMSQYKGDWKYCKVEVSAKLPLGLGTWPAIWMMPTDSVYGEWPKSGEIDICEHVGCDPGVVVSTVHTGKYCGDSKKSNCIRKKDVSEEFHLYGLEWLPDKMIFTVDGKEVLTFDPLKYNDGLTSDIWPFDQRFYLILNLAYGGSWGGMNGVDDSYFPAEYQIEYVRVYQSPELQKR
ncbi:glycoside hydrolase family 16 protein [Butyrivibrio sp. MC2013]|uniref:glycoside hydrolase family 16 protein n=1 Tax=Butyrivibrio sp. MC2013 TaxID=1280686 RepID=UPI0003F69EFD|nr:glycoside hydrolase family 16 protein [Butyrivibrio sp. MC2013]